MVQRGTLLSEILCASYSSITAPRAPPTAHYTRASYMAPILRAVMQGKNSPNVKEEEGVRAFDNTTKK